MKKGKEGSGDLIKKEPDEGRLNLAGRGEAVEVYCFDDVEKPELLDYIRKGDVIVNQYGVIGKHIKTDKGMQWIGLGIFEEV